MDLIFLTSIILLFGGATWFITSPLFENHQTLSQQYSQDELLRKKTLLLRQIKELEMDFHIGNISESDFNDGKNQLKQEISLILTELKT